MRGCSKRFYIVAIRKNHLLVTFVFSISGFHNKVRYPRAQFCFFCKHCYKKIITHGHFQIMNNLVQVLFLYISYITPMRVGLVNRLDCVKIEVNNQKSGFAYPWPHNYTNVIISLFFLNQSFIAIYNSRRNNDLFIRSSFHFVSVLWSVYRLICLN